MTHSSFLAFLQHVSKDGTIPSSFSIILSVQYYFKSPWRVCCKFIYWCPPRFSSVCQKLQIFLLKYDLLTHLSSLSCSSHFLSASFKADEGLSKWPVCSMGSIMYLVCCSLILLATCFFSSSIVFHCTPSSADWALLVTMIFIFNVVWLAPWEGRKKLNCNLMSCYMRVLLQPKRGSPASHLLPRSLETLLTLFGSHSGVFLSFLLMFSG